MFLKQKWKEINVIGEKDELSVTFSYKKDEKTSENQSSEKTEGQYAEGSAWKQVSEFGVQADGFGPAGLWADGLNPGLEKCMVTSLPVLPKEGA